MKFLVRGEMIKKDETYLFLLLMSIVMRSWWRKVAIFTCNRSEPKVHMTLSNYAALFQASLTECTLPN
jgi:hypothetical protein